MTKLKLRDIATSFTATMFIVMAITGILMFFHILDRYTKNLHEILGLAFVVAVIFHVIFNWKGMKSYFTKKVFAVASILVLAVALGFIANTKDGKNPKRVIIDSILNAPINNSFVILNGDVDMAKTQLESAGIMIKTADSIQEIADKNEVSPFKVVDIISIK